MSNPSVGDKARYAAERVMEPMGGPMTEPIRAAEVLERAVGERMDADGHWLTYPEMIDALLALFPEGDVVIRRDGTLAGLTEMGAYERRATYDDDLAYRLVPLSREAE